MPAADAPSSAPSGIDCGNGEPVVLIHGVGLCADAWRPQIDLLSRTHRVIALNMPGHGKTGLLAPDARLPDYVKWLSQSIADIGIDAANVAGHSMGALIALGLAIEHPALVKRLAVLSGVHRRTSGERSAVLARAKGIARGRDAPEATLDRWFGNNAEHSGIRSQVKGWLASANRGGYAAAYQAFAEGDEVYADRLGEIACPALFLSGADDPNSTPAMARRMAGQVPSGKSTVIEGHRHMINLMAADAVNDALQEWLATPALHGRAGSRRQHGTNAV